MNVQWQETGLQDELAREERGRLVVGVDGSAPSEVALRWAAATAAQTHWLIDVVTVWERPTVLGRDAADHSIDWRADAEKVVTAVVDEVFGPHRPAHLRTFVLQGDPAHRLIEHAAGARLLVLGNRGTGGFLGLLLGSVATKCAAHAPCAVLTVHADDVPPGGRS